MRRPSRLGADLAPVTAARRYRAPIRDYPALQLANLIFGGYFSSRWTENIREDKGYTYGPHSRIDHHVLGSALGLDVEVATEVTAPALLETWYELGKIASLPVTAGGGRLGAAVRDRHARPVHRHLGRPGVDPRRACRLRSRAWSGSPSHPRRLLATSVEQVSGAAAASSRRVRFASVAVGDANTIAGPLAGLGAVDR